MSSTMDDATLPDHVDRRGFLNGDWRPHTTKSPVTEIASVLVQVRPECMDSAARAIAAMPGTQIYSRDARGKLVAVIEAPNTGTIGTILNSSSLLPDVLSAALVFHGTDED